VVGGEKVVGDEIRFPYRIAGSMTVDGTTYTFDRMEGGEAVYRKAAGRPQEDEEDEDDWEDEELEEEEEEEDGISPSELPPGAILDPDFVGGTKWIRRRPYRLWGSGIKCGGKYVYVPA